MNGSAPLLAIVHVTADAEHASVDLTLAGRRVQMELGVSVPGLITYEHLPAEFAHHDIAKRAVLDIVDRAVRGELVRYPVNLSDVVRNATTPWPLRAADQKEIEAARAVPITVHRVEANAPALGMVTVEQQVADATAVVVVDARGGRDRPPQFRFLEGVHPWATGRAEAHAMLTALVSAVRA